MAEGTRSQVVLKDLEIFKVGRHGIVQDLGNLSMAISSQDRSFICEKLGDMCRILEKWSIANELIFLKQEGSLDDYIQSFESIVNNTCLNDMEKKDYFMKGLKEDCIPMITPWHFENAKALAKLQEEYSHRIRKLEEERKLKLSMEDDLQKGEIFAIQKKEDIQEKEQFEDVINDANDEVNHMLYDEVLSDSCHNKNVTFQEDTSNLISNQQEVIKIIEVDVPLEDVQEEDPLSSMLEIGEIVQGDSNLNQFELSEFQWHLLEDNSICGSLQVQDYKLILNQESSHFEDFHMEQQLEYAKLWNDFNSEVDNDNYEGEEAYKILMKMMIIIWGWFYKDSVIFFEEGNESLKHTGMWIEDWRIAWILEDKDLEGEGIAMIQNFTEYIGA